MKNIPIKLIRSLLVILAVAASAGCSTIQYRGVQSQFDDAVRADNARFGNPFTDVAAGYQSVADQLTTNYLEQLDSKLQPNAWTLRAVSLWRAGDSTAAVTSALRGLEEIETLSDRMPGLRAGRDSVVLTMLPSLVEDSRLRQRLLENGPGDLAANYSAVYEVKFKTALHALAEARARSTAATPREVLYYWNYQCWRVLVNWAYTISQLPVDAQGDANQDADAIVKSQLAGSRLADVSTLPKATDSVRAEIPGEHPYHQLIELERQR